MAARRCEARSAAWSGSRSSCAGGSPGCGPSATTWIAPRPAFAHAPGHAWEQLALPVLARRSQVLLCPANMAPLAGTRNVVMIYDVAPFMGSWYSPGYARWHRFLLPRVARGAELVVTTSESWPSRSPRCWGSRGNGSPPCRWVWTSASATPATRDRSGPARAGAAIRGGRGHRSSTQEPGPAGPDRAHAGRCRARGGAGRLDAAPTCRAGGMGSGRSATSPSTICRPLYAGARALAMPSLYEGFGLPCLEAMAAGTPVVASDRGALPETCGDAGASGGPRGRGRASPPRCCVRRRPAPSTSG